MSQRQVAIWNDISFETNYFTSHNTPDTKRDITAVTDNVCACRIVNWCWLPLMSVMLSYDGVAIRNFDILFWIPGTASRVCQIKILVDGHLGGLYDGVDVVDNEWILKTDLRSAVIVLHTNRYIVWELPCSVFNVFFKCENTNMKLGSVNLYIFSIKKSWYSVNLFSHPCY